MRVDIRVATHTHTHEHAARRVVRRNTCMGRSGACVCMRVDIRGEAHLCYSVRGVGRTQGGRPWGSSLGFERMRTGNDRGPVVHQTEVTCADAQAAGCIGIRRAVHLGFQC